MMEYPRMMYGPMPAGGEVIVNNEDEERQYLNIGWAYTPQGDKEKKVKSDIVTPPPPPVQEVICFPRMMYHFVYPPKIVNTEHEKGLLEAEGWSITPEAFSAEKALEDEIRRTENKLDVLRANLKEMRERRGAKGPVENSLSIEIKTTPLTLEYNGPELLGPVGAVVEQSESEKPLLPPMPDNLPFLCLICGEPFPDEATQQEHQKACVNSKKKKIESAK